VVLIAYLQQNQGEGASRVRFDDVTVGAWMEKFTALETSPRTGFNASRNRPYSPDTLETYRGYYNTHIKEDQFAQLKMAEVEEEDAMEYVTRLSIKKLKTGSLSKNCGKRTGSMNLSSATRTGLLPVLPGLQTGFRNGWNAPALNWGAGRLSPTVPGTPRLPFWRRRGSPCGTYRNYSESII
jgi:hypothetical protein